MCVDNVVFAKWSDIPVCKAALNGIKNKVTHSKNALPEKLRDYPKPESFSKNPSLAYMFGQMNPLSHPISMTISYCLPI
jgi:hypothetical protein